MCVWQWGTNVTYSWMALVRTNADIEFIFNRLCACNFDLFIRNIIVELLLALELLLVMYSGCWVVLLTWLATTHTWVLLKFNLWDLLQDLRVLLTTSSNWAREVLGPDLVSVFHNLWNFLPHSIWVVNIAWDLNIGRFVILFVANQTYKVVLIFFLAACACKRVSNSDSTCNATCTDSPSLQDFDPFLLLCGFLFNDNFLFRHTRNGYLTLRLVVGHDACLILRLFLVTWCSSSCSARRHTSCALIVFMRVQVLGYKRTWELVLCYCCCQQFRNSPREEFLF